jgi:hypothetical protein
VEHAGWVEQAGWAETDQAFSQAEHSSLSKKAFLQADQSFFRTQ